VQEAASSWGVRLAKRYYARLFKEYAIADLSRYGGVCVCRHGEYLGTCMLSRIHPRKVGK
jgi:hypothetical protein